jgi:hypothetical protein
VIKKSHAQKSMALSFCCLSEEINIYFFLAGFFTAGFFTDFLAMINSVVILLIIKRGLC